MDFELLRAKQAAELLGVNVYTLYRLAAAGDVPSVKRPGIGRRFPREALEAWLRDGLKQHKKA